MIYFTGRAYAVSDAMRRDASGRGAARLAGLPAGRWSRRRIAAPRSATSPTPTPPLTTSPTTPINTPPKKGEDDLKSLTSRAASYAKRVRWVNANRDAIVGAAKELMAAAGAPAEAAVAARR